MHSETTNLAVLKGLGAEAYEAHGKPYLIVRMAPSQWEVYSVEGEAARKFGGSASRDGIERIATDHASGASQASAARFMRSIDERVGRVGPAVREIVDAAGLGAWHMGGGCMSWGKDLGDGTHALVCTEDNDIDGDPAAKGWMVGRYGDGDGFSFLMPNVTLAEAVALIPRMPMPVDANGEPAEITFGSFEEYEARAASERAAVEATKERMGYPTAIKATSVDVGGFAVEVALLGPGTPQSGDAWAVVTHEDCDPEDPTRGASGVEPYDTLDEAVEAWRDTVRSFAEGLRHAPAP